MALFRIFARLAVITALAFGLAACGGGGSSPGGGSTGGGTGGGGGTTLTPPSLVSITVTPGAPAPLTVKMTQAFTATGLFSDGSKANITSQVTWSSTWPTIATISSSGVATGVSAGGTYITATSGMIVSNSPYLQVTAAYVTGISVTPTTATMGVGQSAQLKATGTYSDGSSADITSGTAWSIGNTTIANVSTGLVTSTAPGSTTVTGTFYSYNPVTNAYTTLTGTSNITVSSTYAISGTITALPASGVVALQDNGADNLSITNTTSVATNRLPFVFNTALAPGAVYNVTVASSVLPGGSHPCTVVDGAGVVNSTTPVVITAPQVVCGATVGTLAGNLQNGTPSTTGGFANTSSTVPATQAKFNAPHDIKVDGAGNVYVADTNNNMVRMINASSVVSTYAGFGPAGYINTTTAGSAGTAEFRAPDGLAIDKASNVYVADTGNNVIRVIASSGVVGTVAGATPTQTAGAASPAQYLNSTTLSSARFNAPQGVAVDGNGVVYVADTANNVIRVIKPTGVTTLAGALPVSPYGPALAGYVDSTTPTSVQFNAPTGLVVDKNNTYLYVADSGNCAIRQVVIATGATSTLAGTGTLNCGSAVASTASWTAQFWNPTSVALDASGNLWVVDSGNNVIREIVPSLTGLSTGTVNTVAGWIGIVGFGDGPALSSYFWTPYGIAADASGHVFIGDPTYNLVREFTP